MFKNIPTWNEKFELIPTRTTDYLVCEIDKHIMMLELKDDDYEPSEKAKQLWLNYIRALNEELQQNKIDDYIGNATIEEEELLIAKLEAIEPECVESWSEFLLDLPNKDIGQLLYWMHVYVVDTDIINSGGGLLCCVVGDDGELVFKEEIYNFYKQILPIALVYLNEELLRRLEQLGEMTDVSKDNNNTK